MLHFKAPHDMFDHHPRYDGYLADVEIPEPDNMYDQPAEGFGSVATRGENDELIHVIGSSISKRMTIRNMGMHMKVDQGLPDREYTYQAHQRYLKKYLRCVKGIDDNLKRVFAYLEQAGLMDDTVIFYAGDQGMFLGEHDFIDKRWMYEEAMRMPLLARYPKLVQPGTRCDWLINNTDFAPTMLDLIGVKTPAYMQGRSFKTAMAGGPRPDDWRSATYYRYWMHMAHDHNNPAHFGLRTDRYKLIFFYGCDYTNVMGDKIIEGKGRQPILARHADRMGVLRPRRGPVRDAQPIRRPEVRRRDRRPESPAQRASRAVRRNRREVPEDREDRRGALGRLKNGRSRLTRHAQPSERRSKQQYASTWQFGSMY